MIVNNISKTLPEYSLFFRPCCFLVCTVAQLYLSSLLSQLLPSDTLRIPVGLFQSHPLKCPYPAVPSSTTAFAHNRPELPPQSPRTAPLCKKQLYNTNNAVLGILFERRESTRRHNTNTKRNTISVCTARLRLTFVLCFNPLHALHYVIKIIRRMLGTMLFAPLLLSPSVVSHIQ